MDEGLRNALISAVVAGPVPTVLYWLTASRRIGRLEAGLKALQDSGPQVTARLDTLAEGFADQIQSLDVKLDKHHFEMTGNISALQAALGDARVELVDRVGRVESKLVDRIAHFRPA